MEPKVTKMTGSFIASIILLVLIVLISATLAYVAGTLVPAFLTAETAREQFGSTLSIIVLLPMTFMGTIILMVLNVASLIITHSMKKANSTLHAPLRTALFAMALTSFGVILFSWGSLLLSFIFH